MTQLSSPSTRLHSTTKMRPRQVSNLALSGASSINMASSARPRTCAFIRCWSSSPSSLTDPTAHPPLPAQQLAGSASAWLLRIPTDGHYKRSTMASTSAVTLQHHVLSSSARGRQSTKDVHPSEQQSNSAPFFSPSFPRTGSTSSDASAHNEGLTQMEDTAARKDRRRPRFDPSEVEPMRNSSDPNEDPSPEGSSPRPPWVSAHEYRLRVGRAVHLLRSTLPQFMTSGLVDYPETLPDHGEEEDGMRAQYGLTGSMLVDPLRPGLLFDKSHHAAAGRHGKEKAVDESIYHPNIRFIFRPPINPSASAEEEDTSAFASLRQDHNSSSPSLSFSGRTLYLTSSQVLRTALSAIFSNATVNIERIYLVGGGSSGRGNGSSSLGRTLRSPPGPVDPPPSPSPTGSTSSKETAGGGATSEDELIVRLVFKGKVRVTKYPHEYTAVFRYTFDQDTGQIKRHAVEKIQPAPGRKVSRNLHIAFLLLTFAC